MNLFSIADAAEACLERIRIDQIVAAVRLVALGGIGVDLLRRESLRSPFGWGMIAGMAYLAYEAFDQRRSPETDASPNDRMIAAVRYFWRAATFCLALLLLAWSACHRVDGWYFLLTSLVLSTNAFGPFVFVRWFRWHLQP